MLYKLLVCETRLLDQFSNQRIRIEVFSTFDSNNNCSTPSHLNDIVMVWHPWLKALQKHLFVVNERGGVFKWI